MSDIVATTIYRLDIEGGYKFWRITSDGHLIQMWFRSKNEHLTRREENSIEITQPPKRRTPCQEFGGYYVPDDFKREVEKDA